VHNGSWAITPPVSLSVEVLGVEGDLSWPALAAQVDEHCGSWEPFPSDTLKMEWTVEVEEVQHGRSD
jgi:hypothetical protein